MKEEFTFVSSTGEKLYAIKWYDKENSTYKGIIQIVHGMQEHILRYEELAQVLINCGYIVVGYDQLGHGRSVSQQEEFGYFAKQKGWNLLAEDVHIFQNIIQQQYPNVPYIILGHSMGSLVVRTYASLYQDSISGLILSGTSGQRKGLLSGKLITRFVILVKGEKYRSKLLEYLITGSFNKKFKPTKTKADWTTRDNEQVEKYIRDPLCGKNFTAKAYLDLLQGASYLAKQRSIKNTPQIPILLFSGDRDPVGENAKGVIRVYHMLQKTGNQRVRIRLFKDGRHEMLNEINKQEVYYLILDWLDTILK